MLILSMAWIVVLASSNFICNPDEMASHELELPPRMLPDRK